jgi:2-octaprenyl-3-methyl-6-methoxy-1,4-benzoquinol hydroxylase/2-octaprenylphenol hydroxylase
MRANYDVVVMGAGAAGLAQALALHQRGMRVALIAERWPEAWHAGTEEGLRVIALAPSSVSLFESLGVWGSIRMARAEAVTGMRIAERGGAFGLSFEAAALGVPALAWMVELDLLTDRLAAAWRDSGGASYLDVRISAQRLDSGALELCLSNEERLRTRVLVAADGAASPLRQAAGIDCELRDYGQSGLVATVHTAEPPAGVAWQRFLAGGPLALLPLAERRCSIVWTQPQARVDYLLGLDDASFLAELGSAAGDVLGGFTALGPRASFPLRMQLARRYVSGRMVLLGDAAHQVHPLAGQGLNLGLGDVMALTEVLAWARRGGVDPGDARVLRRYELSQRPRNWRAAHAFDALERIYAVDEGPLARLRGIGSGMVNRMPALKAWLAGQAMGR